MSDAISSILRVKDINDVKKTILKVYENKKNFSKLNIIILNTICGGFGDLIYAKKLAEYLREWYNAKVVIATPMKESLVMLGENSNNVIKLIHGGKDTTCKRFKQMRFEKKPEKQDLIFVAPLQLSFNPSLYDVKYLIDYATVYNTYFFSEYNDSLKKGFDINTGVGGKRSGIFMTDTSQISGKPEKVNYPYTIAYIQDFIDGYKSCFLSFLKMMTTKYNEDRFEIVVPSWMNTDLEYLGDGIVKSVNSFYKKIIFAGKDKDIILYDKGYGLKNVLVLRADILPVKNEEMVRLIRYSVKDILLTGDQSLTDGLSCGVEKNIFYQIADWKINLAKNLAKQLPNKYIGKKRTSCGSLEAISYNVDLFKFIKKWDFRKIGKIKIDAIISFTNSWKNDKKLQDVMDIIFHSRKLSSLKEKLRNL